MKGKAGKSPALMVVNSSDIASEISRRTDGQAQEQKIQADACTFTLRSGIINNDLDRGKCL